MTVAALLGLSLISLPLSDRWRLHGGEQCGLLGPIHSHYWGEGQGLQHSERLCWLQRCEAASASSCLWHSRLQSVSAKPGPPPARRKNKQKNVVTVYIQLKFNKREQREEECTTKGQRSICLPHSRRPQLCAEESTTCYLWHLLLHLQGGSETMSEGKKNGWMKLNWLGKKLKRMWNINNSSVHINTVKLKHI